MTTPNQDDNKVDPRHVEISKQLESMASGTSLPKGTGLVSEAIIYSFDFRDPYSKERVFTNHGFTDDQMKKLVKDLEKPCGWSERQSHVTACAEILNEECVLTKECVESILANKITKKDIGLFGKIVNVVKSPLNMVRDGYRNARHRLAYFVSGKLPRIQCTDEHFCERHQREYDVIFRKFKESQLNRSGSCCHEYITREWR